MNDVSTFWIAWNIGVWLKSIWFEIVDCGPRQDNGFDALCADEKLNKAIFRLVSVEKLIQLFPPKTLPMNSSDTLRRSPNATGISNSQPSSRKHSIKFQLSRTFAHEDSHMSYEKIFQPFHLQHHRNVETVQPVVVSCDAVPCRDSHRIRWMCSSILSHCRCSFQRISLKLV